MALLVAAVFMLANWSFEREAARLLVNPDIRDAADELAERLASQWQAHLASVGLWASSSGTWTKELIEQRAQQKIDLVLSDGDTRFALTALRAVFLEFETNFAELCVAAPGALQWYPVEVADLERLAARLSSTEPG